MFNAMTFLSQEEIQHVLQESKINPELRTG